MPIYNRSGGGGATWQGWKENAKGIVTTQAIAKFDPIVLGTYGDFETGMDKVSDDYVAYPDLETISSYPTGYHPRKGMIWSGDNIIFGSTYPEVTLLKKGTIEDTFEPDYDSIPFIYQDDGTTEANYTCQGIAKTNDGRYIVIAGGYSSTQHFFMVKVNEDGSYTQLDASTLFANCEGKTLNFYSDTYQPTRPKWSSDGQFLGLIANGDLYVFKRSGDEFIKQIAMLSFGTGNNGYDFAFSPDFSYLIVGVTDSPYYKFYWFDAETETLTLDTTLLLGTPTYSSARYFYNVAISPDGKYIVFGDNVTAQCIWIYKDNGDGTFTKLANPDILPGGKSGLYSSFFFDDASRYLIMTLAETPFVAIYEIDNETDTFTKIANPSTLPLSQPMSCAMSEDFNYLSIAFDTVPYIYFYRTESKKAVSKVTRFGLNPLSWIPQNNNLGVSLQAGAVGEEIKINLFPKINDLIE